MTSPGDDDPDATHLAARLHAVIGAPIDFGVGIRNLGAIIGISRCPEDGRDVDGLLLAADEAMYRAKHDGGAGTALGAGHRDSHMPSVCRRRRVATAGIEPRPGPLRERRVHWRVASPRCAAPHIASMVGQDRVARLIEPARFLASRAGQLWRDFLAPAHRACEPSGALRRP